MKLHDSLMGLGTRYILASDSAPQLFAQLQEYFEETARCFVVVVWVIRTRSPFGGSEWNGGIQRFL